MSDRDVFVALLSKIPDASYEELTKGVDPEFGKYGEIADARCAIRISVNPGYRAHFEVEFDSAGTILNMGSWDEL